VQIQAAIDGLALGGIVQLSEGRFNPAAEITVDTAAITIQGAGINGTTIATGAINSFINVSSVDATLRDFELDGFGNTSGTLVTTSALYTHLSRVRMQGSGVAYASTSQQGILFDCAVVNNLKGVQANASGNYIRVIGGNLTSNLNNARLVDIVAGDTMTLIGVNFEAGGTGVVGIYIDMANSFVKAIGCRWETVATGVKWNSGGNTDTFIGCSFADDVTTEFDSAPAGTIITSCAGYVTENSGTATLVNGQTSIAVTHGLDRLPAAGDVMVTPIEAWGSMTEFYIDTYTTTQFTIHSDQSAGQDVDFAWKAIIL
jgi:hypothetical protein